MKKTVVVSVNGEALEDFANPEIETQRKNIRKFAEGLIPLIEDGANLMIMHGNKPQVGFVLYRAEVASHLVHTAPLDICGADTQGATGYMIAQAIQNEVFHLGVTREVVSMVTRTLVSERDESEIERKKPIGPLFDRIRAESYRHSRGWEIAEEPGYGYRRVVPVFKPIRILEIKPIRDLVQNGNIVIGAGGGGIPVSLDDIGNLTEMEAVIDTDAVSGIISNELNADLLIIVVENAIKFLQANLVIDRKIEMSMSEVEKELESNCSIPLNIRNKINGAKEFLNACTNRKVIITTLANLAKTTRDGLGLTIINDLR